MHEGAIALLSHLPYGQLVPVQIFATPFGTTLEVAPAEPPLGEPPSAPLLPPVLEPALVVPALPPEAFPAAPASPPLADVGPSLLEPHPEMAKPNVKNPSRFNPAFHRGQATTKRDFAPTPSEKQG